MPASGYSRPNIALPRGTAVGVLIALALFSVSCGGSDKEKLSVVPPANVGSLTAEQMLKFDSRVQDFDSDGDTLTVNVNENWTLSPVGMRERAVDGWYEAWKTERGSGGQPSARASVVVKFDGNAIARATADQGVVVLPPAPAKPAAN